MVVGVITVFLVMSAYATGHVTRSEVKLPGFQQPQNEGEAGFASDCSIAR